MLSVETMILRILISVAIGGLIGLEREYRNKSAGFRTLILICMGSCLFTLVSIYIGNGSTDRIASNIVTGIGFLGAGVIFHNENKVNGLTTAATIWITAGLGMCAAAGMYFAAAIGCIIVLGILLMLTKFEQWMDKVNRIHVYTLVIPFSNGLAQSYELEMDRFKLKHKRLKQTRKSGELTSTWKVQGSEKAHNDFVTFILKDDAIREFDF